MIRLGQEVPEAKVISAPGGEIEALKIRRSLLQDAYDKLNREYQETPSWYTSEKRRQKVKFAMENLRGQIDGLNEAITGAKPVATPPSFYKFPPVASQPATIEEAPPTPVPAPPAPIYQEAPIPDFYRLPPVPEPAQKGDIRPISPHEWIWLYDEKGERYRVPVKRPIVESYEPPPEPAPLPDLYRLPTLVSLPSGGVSPIDLDEMARQITEYEAIATEVLKSGGGAWNRKVWGHYMARSLLVNAKKCRAEAGIDWTPEEVRADAHEAVQAALRKAESVGDREKLYGMLEVLDPKTPTASKYPKIAGGAWSDPALMSEFIRIFEELKRDPDPQRASELENRLAVLLHELKLAGPGSAELPGTIYAAVAELLARRGGEPATITRKDHLELLNTICALEEKVRALSMKQLFPGGGGGRGGSANPAGSDREVQFNDGGVFGADSAFTFNRTTNVLTVEDISCETITITTDGGLVMTNQTDAAGVGAGALGTTPGAGGDPRFCARISVNGFLSAFPTWRV